MMRPRIALTRVAMPCMLAALFAAAAPAAEQPKEAPESGITAAARRTYSLDAQPRINRLDFDFGTGESNAWLNSDGDFHVHGWLAHPNLLCATYRVGVRFGIGKPGCLNVHWLSEPEFVTSQLHCNGARVEHDGGDALPAIGAQIAQITCAERVIRCSGSCK